MTTARSVVILGPTASGKSDVAMAVAQSTPDVCIVAADAMQVYSRMDIGTAKPTRQDREEVRHYGLDLVEPSERYTVARYVQDITVARTEMLNRENTELIVGGTGLYVTALVNGLNMPGEWPEIREELEANENTEELYSQLSALDPLAASRMESNNRRRIVRALEVCLGSGTTFSSFGEGVSNFPETTTMQIGIKWDREVLRERIALRVHKMMELGLLEEVHALINEPDGLSDTAKQALGYKEMIEHLEGRWTLQEAIDATILRTQQFAIRQERWYRRDPRIQWVEVQKDPIQEVTPHVVAALA